MTDEQNVEQEGQSDVIPFPASEVVGEPEPVQVAPAPARAPLRHLVVETDGDRLTVRNTMGLLELRSALQMLTRQVDNEIDQKAVPAQPVPPVAPPVPPAPVPEPEPAPVAEPDEEPAETGPPETEEVAEE